MCRNISLVNSRLLLFLRWGSVAICICGGQPRASRSPIWLLGCPEMIMKWSWYIYIYNISYISYQLWYDIVKTPPVKPCSVYIIDLLCSVGSKVSAAYRFLPQYSICIILLADLVKYRIFSQCMICHMPGTSSLECYCVVLQGGLLMIISRFSSGYIEMFFLWFGGLNNTLAHFTTLLNPQKAWHWSGSDMLCLPLRSSPECPHAASCCVAHVRVSCPSQLRQAKCSVFVESNSDQIVGRHTGKTPATKYPLCDVRF